MARLRAVGNLIEANGAPVRARVQIDEGCVQLMTESADEVTVLRRLVEQVNSSTCPQPFLLEGPPGCFRLYVGDAAERVRTACGMV